MHRPAILAALVAAASVSIAVPVYASGDDNDPHMKMFTWDGRTFDKDGTHPRKHRGQYGNKAKEGTEKDGSMMKGREKPSMDGEKSGKSPGSS